MIDCNTYLSLFCRQKDAIICRGSLVGRPVIITPDQAEQRQQRSLREEWGKVKRKMVKQRDPQSDKEGSLRFTWTSSNEYKVGSKSPTHDPPSLKLSHKRCQIELRCKALRDPFLQTSQIVQEMIAP